MSHKKAQSIAILKCTFNRGKEATDFPSNFSLSKTFLLENFLSKMQVVIQHVVHSISDDVHPVLSSKSLRRPV